MNDSDAEMLGLPSQREKMIPVEIEAAFTRGMTLKRLQKEFNELWSDLEEHRMTSLDSQARKSEGEDNG